VFHERNGKKLYMLTVRSAQHIYIIADVIMIQNTTNLENRVLINLLRRKTEEASVTFQLTLLQ